MRARNTLGRRIAWIAIAVAGLLCAASAQRAEAEVRVFAAASLKNALDDIAAVWPGASDAPVVSTFAGSSALARQIQHGAPADMFISANAAWMDVLEQRNHLVPGSRFDVTANRLVLIAHGAGARPLDLSAPSALSDRLGPDRLAMALVTAVPAGIYGKAALQSLGHWAVVRDRIAQTDNVRAALALVATGEAPFGIVYASDATASDAVSVAATFPETSHPPIRYPAALIAGRNTDASARFAMFLKTETAREILARHGFSPGT